MVKKIVMLDDRELDRLVECLALYWDGASMEMEDGEEEELKLDHELAARLQAVRDAE